MYPILPPAPSSFLSDPSPFSASSSSSVRPPSPPSLVLSSSSFPHRSSVFFSLLAVYLLTFILPLSLRVSLSFFRRSFEYFTVNYRRYYRVYSSIPFYSDACSLSLSSCFPSFIDGHFISFRLHTHNDVCLPPFLEHGFLENNPRTCK